MAVTAVANRQGNELTNTPVYEKMIMQAKDLFLQVCDENTWKRELSFALQIMEGNKYLQDVAKTAAGAQSIKNAVINVAMTGTTLNPVLQKAYLVPRSVRGTMMCCLDFSYRGLAGIAMDSGSVVHIAPRVVYTFDTFKYTEVDGGQHVTFEKNLLPPPEFTAGPGKFWDYLLCGYVVATLHDGTKIITEPLPKWKLKKAMDTSMTNGEKTPWRTHPDEQCLKTLVKHAYKLLPQTTRMSTAVSVLNEHEGIDTETDKNSIASTLFNQVPEDATFTPVNRAQGMKPESHGTNETIVPLITPEQCDEIMKKCEEYGVTGASFDHFLAFLEVKNIADLPQSAYGFAMSALDRKRQQAASTMNSHDTAPTGSEQHTINDIVNALAAKNLTFQMDEEIGLVQVKLNYQDTSNKEFVKGLGFKWSPEDKLWLWQK